MKKLKTLIVDDEPLAHKVIEGYIEKLDNLEIVGNCYDGISTLNFLQKHQVDIILLDIQMPDISGLELIESLKDNAPKIIITTAYTEYAIESFNYDQVVDYLHKPIRITRFIKAINRAQKLLSLEEQFNSKTAEPAAITEVAHPGYINLKDNKTLYRIPLDEIIYIQSWGNYLKFFLINDELKVVRKTTKSLLSELPSKEFLRIHKSYIVNTKHIKSLSGNQIAIEDIKLPIGQSYFLGVKSVLNH